MNLIKPGSFLLLAMGICGAVNAVPVPRDYKLFVWGNNAAAQSAIPPAITNVTAVAPGGWHTLAIKTDGAVIGWGANADGQCTTPSGLGIGVKAIAGGGKHSLAIKADGTVVAWGYNFNGQCDVPAGLSGVIAVDADSFHTIALKNDGTVVVWGSNFYGEGNVPAGLSNVTQISAGHCCNIVRKSDGTVAAWGQNSSGQCTVPPGLSGVKSVAAGAAHSLALKEDGTIVAWGDNSQGQCNVPAGLTDVKAIATGWNYSVALKSDGSIVMWGNNDDNRCVVPAGLSNAVIISAGENHTTALVPNTLPALTVSFNSLGGSSVESRTCLENTLYGVLPIPLRSGYDFNGWFKDVAYTSQVFADMSVGTEDHVLYAKWKVVLPPVSYALFVWGNNSSAQCAIPPPITNVTAVAPGGWHTLAVKTDGAVIGWGANADGQCNTPSGLGVGVKAIAGGGKHSLAIKADGTVVAWGYNFNGQCNVPAGLSGVIAVDADSFHTIALKSDGTVVVWGSNFYGERNVPAGLSNVTQISAGHCFNIVRKSDGTVAAWGQNSSGQCTVPTGLSGVKSVVAGAAHSLALKEDGTIVSWGDNSAGQSAVPAGLSNVVSIAAGWAYSVALKSDGTIVMWGNNDDNRCVIPAGLANAVFIAAGENHTAALVDTSIVPVTLTVSFNSQGGSSVESKIFDKNAAYGTLPVSSRTGYTLEGWFKDLAAGTAILTTDLVGSTNHTLYAHWTANTYTLNLNAGAGAVIPSTKSITFDNAYGELPMAERPDYLFKGWWTGVGGQGTQILASSVVAIVGNHTLYANWEKIPLLCKPGDDTLLTTQGFYEGFLSDEGDFDGTPTLEVRGTVTLSVFGRADKLNVSAKALMQDRSLVFKNLVWSAEKTKDVSRVKLFAPGGEILDLAVGQTRFWGTLSGGSLGDKMQAVDGMRNRFADLQDAGAQALLNTFRGYYTLAMPAYGALSLGEADAAPEGTGYLTITVGNQGHVNIGGVLADGTKFSKSSSLILFDGCGPEACVPLFVPLYAQKGLMSGLLWFDPVKRTIVTDRDLSWFLRWEKPGSGMDGFSELLEACGGFYSTLDALSAHYRFSAGANAVSYFHSGIAEKVQPVFPSAIDVAADGRRLVITKGVAPLLANGAYDYAASENSSMATLSFREATGVFSGSFKVYYDYTAQERLYHKAVTVQYSGVLVPRRSEVFVDLPIGQGFYLVPDNNPALAPQSLKRSYLIELEADK
jgi:uncharacterized repeat protein (TIGR02543 family)